MTLAFPNPSRSFDEARNAVLFFGHDGVFEIRFFVEAGALAISGTALPTMPMSEEVSFSLRRRPNPHSGRRARGVLSRTSKLLHSHRRGFPIEAGDADPLRLRDEFSRRQPYQGCACPSFTTIVQPASGFPDGRLRAATPR